MDMLDFLSFTMIKLTGVKHYANCTYPAVRKLTTAAALIVSVC